jgi:hypothetical protein
VLATEPAQSPLFPTSVAPTLARTAKGAARRNPLIPRLAQSEPEKQSRDPRRNETRRVENRSWCCGCDRGEGPPRLQMIDSKRFHPSLLPFNISPGAYIYMCVCVYIYIYTYLCNCLLSFQLSLVGAGTCWSIYSQRPPTTTHLFFFFCCCAELSKSVLVRRTALSHWRPSTPNIPQKLEESPPFIPPSSVSSSSSGSWIAAGAGVTPSASPGNRNLASGKPRGPGFQDMFLYAGRLGWSIGIAAIRNLPHRHKLQSLPARPPHSTHNAGPASRIFLHELRVGCCLLSVANQLAA